MLVPVLGRPTRVKPTLDGFRETVPYARILFIASPGDKDEIDALESVEADTLIVNGGYAAKIRGGVYVSKQPLIFTAADDLRPIRRWFEKALAHMQDDVQVVGINDRLKRRRRGEHSTHFLMTREYANLPCLDGKPGPFSTAYRHQFCDDELIATAKTRRAYAYARDSQFVHLHPMAGHPSDETYKLGQAAFRDDRETFKSRRALWA